MYLTGANEQREIAKILTKRWYGCKGFHLQRWVGCFLCRNYSYIVPLHQQQQRQETWPAGEPWHGQHLHHSPRQHFPPPTDTSNSNMMTIQGMVVFSSVWGQSFHFGVRLFCGKMTKRRVTIQTNCSRNWEKISSVSARSATPPPYQYDKLLGVNFKINIECRLRLAVTPTLPCD